MKRHFCMVVMVVAVVACTGSALAAVNIQLDFGRSTSPVQDGWVGVTAVNRLDNGSHVSLGDGVIAGAIGWNKASEGDRGAGSSGVPAQDDLLRDFLQPSTSQVVVGGTWFEVRGLPAGTYSVTLLTGDPSYPASDEYVLLNGVDIDLPEFVAGGTYPDAYGVTVPLTLAAGENISLGRSATGWGKMSGLIITPEPATLALLGMCVASALIRRRR